MLDWFATQRFAPNDSPFRERRLCLFSPVPGAPVAGQNPESEGANTEGHEHENTGPNAVDGQQHATGQAVQSLLQKEKPLSQEVRERLGSVEKKLTETEKRLRDAESLVKSSTIDQKQKHIETLNANYKVIGDTQETVVSWNRLLGVVDDWGGGKMHPSQFCNAISKDLYGKNKAGENVNMRSENANDMLEEFYKVYPNARNWETLNAATRIELANESKNFVLEYMQKYLKKLDTELQKQQDYGTILAQNKKELEEQKKRSGGGLGIEFYSINHAIAAASNVFDAFKKAGEEWSQLKVAGLSHKLGKMVSWVPIIGDSALQTLEATLNHKDDDVAKHYQEHLESDLAPFDHMVDGHHGPGLLSRNKNDGNRFRGSLQYMAKHAWLYDIDFANNSVMGYKLIPGKTLPSTWADIQIREYLRDLERQNQAGQDSETKRGYARVDFAGSIDTGVAVLREEIELGNYWAVRGISQRLLAKAKDGYTATWLATSIMRMLRENETARRYFPFELFDRLGNEGLQHLAMTNISWVKDRYALREWQKATWNDKDKANERVAESGIMGKVTKQLEDKIRAIEKAHHVEEKDQLQPPKLDRLIAKILATRIIDSKEDPEPEFAKFKGITIFTSEFSWYREQFRDAEGNTVDPGKTDDDFTKEDSEIVLHGTQIASSILKDQSPANLVYDAKATAYLGQLIRRDRQLTQNNLTGEPQDNFRKETQATMRHIFRNTWTADGPKRFVELTYEGTVLLKTMVAQKLIDIEDVRTINTPLAKALCVQLGVKHASLDETDKKKLIEKAKADILDLLKQLAADINKASEMATKSQEAATSIADIGSQVSAPIFAMRDAKLAAEAKQAEIDAIPAGQTYDYARRDAQKAQAEVVTMYNAMGHAKANPQKKADEAETAAKEALDLSLEVKASQTDLNKIKEELANAEKSSNDKEMEELMKKTKALQEDIREKIKKLQEARAKAEKAKADAEELLRNFQANVELANEKVANITKFASQYIP